MVRKSIHELKGNEILAKPIMTWDYQMILPQGAQIKQEYIGRLEELGIMDVFVKKGITKELNSIAILKSDIEYSMREKVKDILERHTYQNNEELAELSSAADNIITNILEDEQVVDKIYDIKERSTDIYEHSLCICSLSILTALKLKLDAYAIHDIGVGSLLHDIGLRYTTIDFSQKDVASLNYAEMKEYRKHPVNGYSSLQKELWISPISKQIILYHHERLDGTGFPLHTREIPLECRIVNVCDAFDEMICGITSKQIKVHEAIEYLKTYSGIAYDERVVNALLSFTAVYPAGSRVYTSEREIAVVVRQNKEFQDRPVLRIIKDKDGNDVTGEVIKDMVKIPSLFIEEVLND